MYENPGGPRIPADAHGRVVAVQWRSRGGRGRG